MVASVFDDMAKMAGDRSTGWTNHFLWDIFPFIKESDLQSIGILVGLPTSPALKDGSHWEVHWLEIRAWGGPHWLVTKRWKHQFSKVLDKNRCVLVHHPAWMYKAGSHKCFGAIPTSQKDDFHPKFNRFLLRGLDWWVKLKTEWKKFYLLFWRVQNDYSVPFCVTLLCFNRSINWNMTYRRNGLDMTYRCKQWGWKNSGWQVIFRRLINLGDLNRL